MQIDVRPEPSDEERAAIAAALSGRDEEPSEWGEAALAEGVDAGDQDA